MSPSLPVVRERMPVIQINDHAHPLSPGTTRLGSGPGVDVEVGGAAGSGVEALVELTGDRQASVRRARDGALVRVNGVALGAEPMPLLHGDRLEVLGQELRYAEDAQAGATQVVTADSVAAMVAARQGARRATAATGGRLVSLVDGKEYEIPDEGVTLGRDASCDVVVPQTEVSRRHARIVPGPDGYTVVDMSANGVYVNGTRVAESQLLARADVLRVGSEEFRFYAPVAAPPRPAEPVSAVVEVLEPADIAGQRFELRSGPARIGRGAFNEIVLAHPSVSESHAVLLRGPGGWSIRDEGSTNGTWFGADKLAGERALTSGTELRAGGVRLRFSPVSVSGSTMQPPGASPTPAGAASASPFGLSAEIPPSLITPSPAQAHTAGAAPAAPAATPAPLASKVAASSMAASSAAPGVPAPAAPAPQPPVVPASGAAPARPAAPRGPAPKPVTTSAETRTEEAARRGLPPALWIVVALLVGAGIYFVLQAR